MPDQPARTTPETLAELRRLIDAIKANGFIGQAPLRDAAYNALPSLLADAEALIVEQRSAGYWRIVAEEAQAKVRRLREAGERLLGGWTSQTERDAFRAVLEETDDG